MAQAYEIQNWIIKSRQETEAYLSHGLQRGPVAWVWSDYVKEHNLQPRLIRGGEENGSPWFISRALHHGALIPGKVKLEYGASIGFGNDAIQLKQYEVLVGDQRGIKWVSAHGKLNIGALGARPIEAGHDVDNTPLFICRAKYKDGIHPGKASPQLHGGYITYGKSEKGIDNYEVLCYA